MKKLIALLICLSFLILDVKAYSAENNDNPKPTTEALGAVVMEAKSGRVLFGKDIHKKLPMASTTKILTTIIALEQNDITEDFMVYEKDFIAEGSSMGLKDKDIVNLEDLAVGMILPSGNDAANAVAVKIAGSQEDFSVIMNDKAIEIGLMESHFVTPSGLDDDMHYSQPMIWHF